MKKLCFVLIPLITVPFFASCNKGLGNPKPLNECSWDKINEVSKAGKASEWFKIGDTTTVKINNVNHTARIIGFNHDVDKDGNKVGITFEFVNLLSDKDGYSLATTWNWNYNVEKEYPNEDFTNSTLRKALDGEGSGSIAWYQKGSPTKSTTYTKSALEMLPNDLQNVLKDVVKPIVLYDDSQDKFVVNTTDYKTKLFPLSYREMTKDERDDVLDEGTTYEYYKKHDDNLSRILKQVKGTEVCTEGTEITDAVITHAIPTQNYAGFNGKNDETGGGVSWLRSPTTAPYYQAISNQSGGKLTDSVADMNIFAVAPAFCI